MSYRYMRVIVFFDLPVETSKNRKDYRLFRRHLIKSGFIMLQESVYVKLVPNSFAANTIVNNIRRHSPENGLIQVLKVTEKQYSAIENIVGRPSSQVIDTDERLVVL